MVPDRTRARDVAKVLGFMLMQNPLRLTLPPGKASMLQASLLWTTGSPMVDTSLLRSLVGVWIWAASLNRVHLSIPSTVFKFIDNFFSHRVPWWASARKEIKLMAYTVASLVHHLALPSPSLIFATDAEGANHLDCGGWGIVATHADRPLLEKCFAAGNQTGCTIARLDGSFKHLKDPLKEMAARIPISKIPKDLMADPKRWAALWHGRWKHSEHITLGEGRTTNILLEHLVSLPEAHSHRIMSLCDNMPWCMATTKGRSPTYRLNVLLRRRSALLLASGIQMPHPWMDTARMPADSFSRRH